MRFFSFLAAMMLAYQPVRSLATLNITINQGLAGARRILPVIDLKEKIFEDKKFKYFSIFLYWWDSGSWMRRRSWFSVRVKRITKDGPLGF